MVPEKRFLGEQCAGGSMCGWSGVGGILGAVDGASFIGCVELICFLSPEGWNGWLMLSFWTSRCRRVGRCQGPISTHEPMRARSVPEDEDLGADECHARLLVPSEYLDTTRYVCSPLTLASVI